jgi:paraquat-inducible protein A
MAPSSTFSLTCRLCGQTHPAITLHPGESARCIRCSSTLASEPRYGGAHASTAFALTGLVFAVPAALLPFITVEKLGNARSGDFLASVSALASHGMPTLAVWVLICGGLTPLLLLTVLVFARGRFSRPAILAGRALAVWAMPEVFVLAVFVALTRLNSIVDVDLNAGFWSYVALSCATLLAWRTHRLGST